MINENCPACFEAPKERHHIKKLLAREEGVFPSLYPSLRKALIPLLDPSAMDLLAAVQRTVEEASEGTRRAMRQRGSRLDNGKTTKKGRAETKPDSASVALENNGDGDDGGKNNSQSNRGRNCALGEATEAELLEELVRRRQAVRSGGRFSSDLNQQHTSSTGNSAVAGDNGHPPGGGGGAANSREEGSGGVVDTELNGELVELQTFCTADGCERHPVEL